VKKLSIIYHSRSGHTEALAQAIVEGASTETEVTTTLVRAFDAGLEHLSESDGVIFGTPENFGYMSGALKDFFDRTYDDALPMELNLPYAIFVSAGNDGTGAVREIDRILRGYPLKKVAEPVISRKKVSDEDLEKCRELGATLAAGLAFGIF
jgi:multimeric flavodoxin WrbA